MNRRVTQVASVLALVLVGAQFARPEHTNPPTDPRRTIQAAFGTKSALAAVVERSCGDCHSNDTVWSWYAQVAPLSWLMARSVAEGRKALNFSEWAGYQSDVRRMLLVASCNDVRSGKMPGPYTLFRPSAKLSPRDIETVCGAARTFVLEDVASE